MTEVWYAVCEDDGSLVSIGTVVADPLPKGLVVYEIPERPFVPSIWDKQEHKFVPKVKAEDG